MRLVRSPEEVREAIKRFNADLGRSRKDPSARALAARLGYNRAWYYDPESNLVGPSKFVGYSGMTAHAYVHDGALDGRRTEPVLQQWFRPLEPGTREESVVRRKVEALLAPHHRRLNRAVRFCAPVGWSATVVEQIVALRERHVARAEVRHRVDTRRRTIAATVSRGERMFVAECDHLAVVTQGATVDEALENLKEAVALHLEGEDLEALGFAPAPILLVTMELSPWAA